MRVCFFICVHPLSSMRANPIVNESLREVCFCQRCSLRPKIPRRLRIESHYHDFPSSLPLTIWEIGDRSKVKFRWGAGPGPLRPRLLFDLSWSSCVVRTSYRHRLKLQGFTIVRSTCVSSASLSILAARTSRQIS